MAQEGIERLRLLTNNPEKVGALQRHGIAVSGRVPLEISANPHDWRYRGRSPAPASTLTSMEQNVPDLALA